MKYTILFLALFLPGCSLFYVAKQGSYQLKLLSESEPIKEVLRTKSLPVKKRQKLMLIFDVREYAQRELHLNAKRNYMDVNLSFNHTLFNVSGSKELQFKPYLWWFPILGHVPYKGFFEEKDADHEVIKLKNEGYQTLKRKVGGYSTLGYFSDPVWPAMLEMSDESLVELIIHELTHATFYIPYQTPFNETLANFIGIFGAKKFFKDNYGEESDEYKKLDKTLLEEKIYKDFFSQLYNELDNVYTSDKTDKEKMMLRDAIMKNAHERFMKLPLDSSYKNLPWSYVNNAFLMAFKIYNYDETVFVRLMERVQGDFERFFYEISVHSDPKDPFGALKNYLQSAEG